MDDLKNGRIIGYDHYVKMFVIIFLLIAGGLTFFIITVPMSKLLSIRMLPMLIVFPIALIGIGATLITERKKILFQIERDYDKTCDAIESYLKEIECDHSVKKNNVPFFNTSTSIVTTKNNFKINIKKSPLLLGIQMGPIKTVKIYGEYFEDRIMDIVRKIH